MSRFTFRALLALLLCMACTAHAYEVPSNPFSSFGLFYNYVTSGSVKLKVDGRPDYSGVKSFVADGVKFGGMVRSDHTGAGYLPRGTLSILSGDSYSQGRNFKLWQSYYRSAGSSTPNGTPDTPSLSPYAGQFIDYRTDEYYSISEMAGKWVM